MSEHNIIAFKAELFRSAFALHCSLLCVAIICHIVSWTLLDQFRSGAVFNILATILLLSGRIWLHSWEDDHAAWRIGCRMWVGIITVVLLSSSFATAFDNSFATHEAWYRMIKTWWGGNIALLISILLGFLHMSCGPSACQSVPMRAQASDWAPSKRRSMGAAACGQSGRGLERTIDSALINHVQLHRVLECEATSSPARSASASEVSGSGGVMRAGLPRLAAMVRWVDGIGRR